MRIIFVFSLQAYDLIQGELVSSVCILVLHDILESLLPSREYTWYVRLEHFGILLIYKCWTNLYKFSYVVLAQTTALIYFVQTAFVRNLHSFIKLLDLSFNINLIFRLI